MKEEYYLDKLSAKALECAVKRGKVDLTNIFKRNSRTAKLNKQKQAITAELVEFLTATEKSSKCVPFTEDEEEAADVIIATMTYLAMKGVSVERLISSKMNYNETREK